MSRPLQATHGERQLVGIVATRGTNATRVTETMSFIHRPKQNWRVSVPVRPMRKRLEYFCNYCWISHGEHLNAAAVAIERSISGVMALRMRRMPDAEKGVALPTLVDFRVLRAGVDAVQALTLRASKVLVVVGFDNFHFVQ